MKQLVLLLTGLTDAPLQDLGGLTPLQKAHTPELDRLARTGSAFSLIPPKLGGIETSLLALLGIEEGLEATTAAPIEACAVGLPLCADETYYCGRLVSAGGGVIVEVGDDLIGDKEGALLCQALTEEMADEGIRFFHVEGPKCLMMTRRSFGPIPGPGASPFEVVGKNWKGLLPKKVRAQLGKLLERADKCLEDHEVNQLRADLEEVPVNALWILEGGRQPRWMENSYDWEGCAIWYSTSVIGGIAKTLNIPFKELDRSLRMDEELALLVKQLDEELPETLFVELPYLWESTYKGDLLEKIKRIEYLDRHLIGPLAAKEGLSILPLRHTDIRIGHVASGPVPMLSNEPGGISLTRFDEPAFSALPTKRLSKALRQPALV